MGAYEDDAVLQRLYRDLEAASVLAGVVVEHDIVWPILLAYRERFARSAVSFRTSTRALDRRSLNVRYVEFDRLWNPLPTALRQRFLIPGGHAIEDLVPQIQREIPLLGYGIDIGVEYGLEKIWAFFPHCAQPIERLRALPALPRAIYEYGRYFADYGFNDVSILALDYRRRSVNLYFMRQPDSFPTATLSDMVSRLGFPVPGADVLRHCARSVAIYFTFSWDSPRIDRLCFGVIAPEPRLVPVHLHPLIARYVAGAPFDNEQRIFIYNVTLSREELFFKIENDYNGAMHELLRPPRDASRSQLEH